MSERRRDLSTFVYLLIITYILLALPVSEVFCKSLKLRHAGSETKSTGNRFLKYAHGILHGTKSDSKNERNFDLDGNVQGAINPGKDADTVTEFNVRDEKEHVTRSGKLFSFVSNSGKEYDIKSWPENTSVKETSKENAKVVENERSYLKLDSTPTDGYPNRENENILSVRSDEKYFETMSDFKQTIVPNLRDELESLNDDLYERNNLQDLNGDVYNSSHVNEYLISNRMQTNDNGIQSVEESDENADIFNDGPISLGPLEKSVVSNINTSNENQDQSNSHESSQTSSSLLESYKNFKSTNKKHGQKLLKSSKKQKQFKSLKERRRVSKKSRQNKARRKRTESPSLNVQLNDNQRIKMLSDKTQSSLKPSSFKNSDNVSHNDKRFTSRTQMGANENKKCGTDKADNHDMLCSFTDDNLIINNMMQNSGYENHYKNNQEAIRGEALQLSERPKENKEGYFSSNYSNMKEPQRSDNVSQNISIVSVSLKEEKSVEGGEGTQRLQSGFDKKENGFAGKSRGVEDGNNDHRVNGAKSTKEDSSDRHYSPVKSNKVSFKDSKSKDENAPNTKPGKVSDSKKDDLRGYQGDQGRNIYNTPLTSRLELINGLYHGLRVSVTDRVAAENCRDVIEGLKTSLQGLSFAMHSATDGLAGLGSVTIELPHHWSTRSCIPPSPTPGETPHFTTQSPQIIVDAPHAVFGDAPWTQQSGACGRPGDFIQLGVEFLKTANTSDDSGDRAGRILLAEWAKFRWGVFSESGYEGDPLYPPWYSVQPSSWEPNVCSDVMPLTHAPSCPPHIRPRCPWPQNVVENATSSILGVPQLPKVSKFCNRATHNPDAPTKQNALCDGRSTWEVISQSKDFKDLRMPRGRPVKPPPNPRLFFTRAPPLRFVVLVEDTEVMNTQRRWDFVRKSVRRAIVYDLPDEAQAGVIVFNAKTKEVAPLSTLDSQSDLRERVGSSLPRNPSRVRPSQACIACALRAAARLLKHGNASPRGATIILITAGDQTRVNEKEAVQRAVAEEGLKLVLVLYPLQERPGFPVPPHALVRIARESGGSVFTVMDEGVGTDSKVNMLVSLMEALRSAVRAGGAETPILVHSATYPGGITPHSMGTFSLDSSLAAHARFAVYYYDLNHVGNAIHLTAPSGATFASVNMQEEDGDVNMIFVNLHNAEKGVWRYKVENRADSHQGLHIQVTAQPNKANDVTIRVWTSQDEDEPEHDAKQRPIIMYGEVKIDGIAVLNAGVMAVLQRLGTNATGGTYPPVHVALLDLGTGDPDITKGDGIYSRYAPPLDGPSRYALTLTVDASKASLALSHSHSSHLPTSSSAAYSAYKTINSPYGNPDIGGYQHQSPYSTDRSTYRTQTSSGSREDSTLLGGAGGGPIFHSASSMSGLTSKKTYSFVDSSSDTHKLFKSSLHSIETPDEDFPSKESSSKTAASASSFSQQSSSDSKAPQARLYETQNQELSSMKSKTLASSEEYSTQRYHSSRQMMAPPAPPHPLPQQADSSLSSSPSASTSSSDSVRHRWRRGAAGTAHDTDAPMAAQWSSSSLYSYYNTDHAGLHQDEGSILPDEARGWGMASPPCCGSVVPYAQTRQAPPFTRFVTGPTLEIWDANQKDVDGIPPGRITDLTAWVNSSTGNVVLEWTAVGTDRDWGRAHHYFAAVTSSKAQASNSCTGKHLKGLPAPAPAGTKEEAAVNLRVNEKRTLYVCIRALDAAGNSGSPSNAAPVWLPRPPAIDRVTLRDQGLGYSSSLGTGSGGKGERVAVIAGSVGGVILVVLLLVGYCYCFPAGFARRNGRKNNHDPAADDDQHKNGNGSVPLVNGGSLVVTSASRGSVLLNVGNEGGNSTNDSPSVMHHRVGSNGGDDRSLDNRRNSDKNDEFPRALEPQLRSVRNDGDANQTLSMSIPDVTRVEPQQQGPAASAETSQPQFFTLGRATTRTNSNSSSTSSRHSFHDRAGPSSLSPHHDNQRMSQYVNSGLPLDLSKTSQDPLKQAGQGSGGNLYMYRNIEQPLDTNGEVGSLYRDGSIGGDSLNEGLLCDDRTASPPPPAPSGPSDRSRASPFAPMNRRSLAML